jgi:hypothetical protein
MYLEQALAAQRAVDVHGSVGGGDAVLAQRNDGGVAVPRGVEQRAERGVYFACGGDRFGPVRAVSLEVVVEVGDVDEQEVGVLRGEDPLRGVDDPARGCDRRGRPPVGEQRERAELGGQLIV